MGEGGEGSLAWAGDADGDEDEDGCDQGGGEECGCGHFTLHWVVWSSVAQGASGGGCFGHPRCATPPAAPRRPWINAETAGDEAEEVG